MEARLAPGLAESLRARNPTDAEWALAFPVRTADAASAEPPGPSIFGRYVLKDSSLVFRPRLPFLSDTDYRAVVDLEALRRLAGLPTSEIEPSSGPGLSLSFRIPSTPSEAPRVVSIHPGASRVPGNLLRAYVEFSRSMRPDVAADYVRLVDDAGELVPLPFVEIDAGLWDPAGERLTLLFHPGRLKRGVAPRDEMGPPLEADRTYRLEIASGWPSVTGEPLAEPASRTWTVGPDDRSAVAPSSWVIEPPRADTDDPLTIDFGEPLDHALAQRLITVLRDGEPIPGEVALGAGDTRWIFRPATQWRAADHILRVDAALEDLAGNNLRGAFDRGEDQAERAASAAEIPFRPRR